MYISIYMMEKMRFATVDIYMTGPIWVFIPTEISEGTSLTPVYILCGGEVVGRTRQVWLGERSSRARSKSYRYVVYNAKEPTTEKVEDLGNLGI